jgi:hypothetical protein
LRYHPVARLHVGICSSTFANSVCLDIELFS